MLTGYKDRSRMGQRLSSQVHGRNKRFVMPRASWEVSGSWPPKQASGSECPPTPRPHRYIDFPRISPRCRRQRRRRPACTTPAERAGTVPNAPSCTRPLAPRLPSPPQARPDRLFPNRASSIRRDYAGTGTPAAIRMDRDRLLRLRLRHPPRQRNHRQSASGWEDPPRPLFQLVHLVPANFLRAGSARRAKRVRSRTSGTLDQRLQRSPANSSQRGRARWGLFVCLTMSSPRRHRSTRHRALHGPLEVCVNPRPSPLYSLSM